jgi:tRNA threonylcarbamoyladenosine dehydratase
VQEYDKNFVHPTAPSLNFVTNMVGCWIVAEAIKVLTGKGKIAHYPKYLEFDTFELRMRLRNSLSPIDPINIKRVSGLVKSKLNRS